LKKTTCAIILLFLVGCSSVPLSSMFKIANLDTNDILAINPAEVKVRLSVSDPVELKTENVRLALKFDHYDGSQSEYLYLLEIVDVSLIDPISSWFSSQPLKHAYQFKLGKLSQLEFNKYQLEYAKQGKPKRYHWSVFYSLKPTSGDSDFNHNPINEMTIDMELKLSNQEDYFFLLKSAPIKIN